MKKIGITLLLISLAGMALFAEGAQEETTGEPGMGRGYISEDQINRGPGTAGRGSMPMRGGMVQNQGTWGPSGRAYPNRNISEESVTLTGSIDFSNINQPKLTVADTTYELMVPYRLDYDIDIKDGDEITIRGFEVPATGRTSDSEFTNLMVTGATVNGKDYEINNGPMAYNQRAGMMNNHGPANGRKGQSGRFNNSRFSNNFRNCGPQPNGMQNRPYGRR